MSSVAGKRPRILFVITKLELGGAQKQLLAIIRGLNQQRFQPFLFTARAGLLIEDAQAIPGLELLRSRFLERKISPLKDFLSFLQLCLLIKKNKIRAVHTHSSKAGILGRLAARSCGVAAVVHTVHGWSFNDSQPAWKRRLFIWLERLCAHFSSRLIIVSDHDLRIGLRLHIGRPGKYQRINYGIDYAEFQRPASEARRAFSLAAGDLAVGTVSCFKPQKSPQDFIRLAGAVKNQVHQVKFILAGDGILRRQIERLIKRHKLEDSVLLLGWRRDIPQILSSLDVLVLTSLWEGLPIAVLEAMAASLPVVATDTGGIAEIVSDGKTGFLKKPQDVAGLAERLITLLRDADLRKSMGRAGKEALGETFRLEKMQKSYYNLYSELLRTKGRQDDNE